MSKKRGPYKKYLQNPDIAMPKTSRWRKQKQSLAREDAVDFPEVIVESAESSTVSSTAKDHVLFIPSTSPVTGNDLEELTESFSGSYDNDDIPVCENSNDQLQAESINAHQPKEKFHELYEGSSLSMVAFNCLFMKLARKHKLTYQAMDDLLDFVSYVLPKPNTVPKSIYLLKKFFSQSKCDSKTQIYCTKCNNLEDNCECDHPNPGKIVSISVEKPLKSILTDNFDSLIYRGTKTTCVTDVWDSSYIQKDDFFCEKNRIALSLCCDGVPIYKSSKTKFWPFYLLVLNLHPSIRTLAKNIMIAGLWVGPSDAPMDYVFKPLTKMLDSLSTNGITITSPAGRNLVFKAKLVMGVFDLPAKADVLSCIRFNGEFGCTVCLHPGVQLSHRRVYPPRLCSERNHETVTRHARKAVHLCKPVKGIKAISPLTNHVDLVDSIPVDYMHSVLEGTVRRLMKLWFNSENHRKPFYLGGKKLKEIDKLLLLQRPPKEFTRSPRSISKHHKYWKASELRQWLLFYSLPILCGQLPSVYFQHYALLVSTMHILLKNEITCAELEAAEIMIRDFSAMFEELYGTVNFTHNMHLLSHLVKYVKLWGPLWTHSAFCFENKNGLITKLFHGNSDITDQIIFNVNAEYAFQSLMYDIKQQDGEQVAQYIYETRQNSNMIPIYSHVYVVGKTELLGLTAEEQDIIQHYENVQGFYRLFKDGAMYHCTNYKQGRTSKRNDTYCQYMSENNIICFGQIQQFLLTPKPLALIKEVVKSPISLTEQAGYSSHPKLQRHLRINFTENVIMSFVQSDTVEPVEIQNIIKKAVAIETKIDKYLSALPNPFEYH